MKKRFPLFDHIESFRILFLSIWRRSTARFSRMSLVSKSGSSHLARFSRFEFFDLKSLSKNSATELRDSFNAQLYRTSQGFSLIELLVVISIMSILMALAAISYSTAQQRGRDARRRGDMSAIQKGFEEYFAANNTYDSAASCTTMGAATSIFPAGLPSDPRNVAPNTYSFRCSATAYCVCARLEATNAGNSTAAASSTTCSFASSGATSYYCVTNLQ